MPTISPENQKLLDKIAALEKEVELYKEAIKKNASNEKNFTSFFNSINDFIFILDEQGNIILVNEYVIDRLGYSLEELKGKSVLMVHPSERRDEAARIVAEMLQGKTEYCPIPIVTKKGQYIPVETRVTMGTWDEKPVILGISKDISEIRLSEEKFSKAFHNNANLMAISNYETGEYLDVNESFLKALGLSREEVIGKTSIQLNILTPELRLKILEGQQTGERITGIELSLNIKGKELTGLFSYDTIYIQDKKCLLTVMQDITERKKFERELTHSETRLRLAIEGGKVGTWDWNVQTGTVIFNTYWAEMLEYSLEEIEPHVQSWEKLVHPEDMPQVMNTLSQHLNGETDYYRTEHRMLTKSGKWKWVLDLGKVTERDKHGDAIRALGIHVNIDEIKTAHEELLLMNDQLAEMNQAKNKLFSIIAHDLRNPFTAILGFSDLLQEGIHENNTEKMDMYVQRIHSTARSTYNLLEDLLIWAKSQFDKIEFEAEELNLYDMLEEVITLSRNQAEKKDIRIVSHLTRQLLAFGDKNMINTVIRNLVSNAIKFTYSKGLIDIYAVQKNGEIQITIADNGTGITQEEIDRLFILEQNPTKYGTANEKGTGFGLVLCQDLVKRNSGKIWAESTPGEGSRFIFTLPAPPK